MWPLKQLDSYVPVWEDCQDIWKVDNIQNSRNIMISFCEKEKKIICIGTLNVSGRGWGIWYRKRIYFNVYMLLLLFVVIVCLLYLTIEHWKQMLETF